MIEITSYLRTKSGSFVDVAEASFPPADPSYVEGAIDMTINGVRILDQELWDYVDELWAYIGDMVLKLADEDEVSTYFPDQPIRLLFKRLGGGLVLVSLTYDDVKRTVPVEERELVDALQRSGTEFFTRMKELLPENALGYDDALTRLTR
ncbi:hypothetical protein [Streptomyces tropicalis]|uniref:Uncharacterized protein n=1 Tax=Streptomyces tropicalis TaxID=3034234 RepID=A0ABT6A1N4_9ACTN|nr:hypothetical protein [Streptomyces tropicalis]MDF3298562.1 hypothetical protein [Streptomyces tropicalis]